LLNQDDEIEPGKVRDHLGNLGAAAEKLCDSMK
jgi:hypothetical protein